MPRLIGTGRMNRSGGAGTLTVPNDLADTFDLDEDGVDVAYIETDAGEVLLKPADEISF